MANKKTITPEAVKELIAKKAEYDIERMKIYKEAKALDKKLGALNEGYMGFASSFGFDHKGDYSKKSKTGFVEDPVFSSLTSLGSEITAELKRVEAEEAEASKTEVEKLQESFTSQMEELKKQFKELKAKKSK